MADYFSIKMRSAADGRHLSGAEGLLRVDLPTDESEIFAHSEALLKRALRHPRGEPQEIHLTVKKISSAEIARLPALSVRTIAAATVTEGRREAEKLLAGLGVNDAAQIFTLLPKTYAMRGAMLWDIDTGKRLEPDLDRGIRATLIDAENVPAAERAQKNHFREALILATKVAHAPGIVAEICVSDDPDYVAGYVAAKAIGYVRISPLKETGDPHGGRIFCFRGDASTATRCRAYLEQQPVIVESAPPHW